MEGFNHFPQIANQLRPLLSQVVRKTAFDIQAQAASRAPVRTGFLRNSIVAQMQDDLNATVTVGASYGIYVEMGTRRMSARPYFFPAVEQVRPGFEAAMAAIESRFG